MVQVIEVSPRDGLQNENVLLDTAANVALVEHVLDSGARRIEATSFVHPVKVPQMADDEAVMAAIPRNRDASYTGLVVNRRGLDRALAAEVEEIIAVVVASDTFNRRNQGVGTEGSLEVWADIAASARASLICVAGFGCRLEGAAAVEQVLEVLTRGLRARPDELALARIVGVGVPSHVTALIGGVPRSRRCRAATTPSPQHAQDRPHEDAVARCTPKSTWSTPRSAGSALSGASGDLRHRGSALLPRAAGGGPRVSTPRCSTPAPCGSAPSSGGRCRSSSNAPAPVRDLAKKVTSAKPLPVAPKMWLQHICVSLNASGAIERSNQLVMKEKLTS